MTPDEHTMLVETAARAKNLESAADQYKAPLAALQKDVDEIKAALASGAAGPTAAQIADEIAKRLKD